MGTFKKLYFTEASTNLATNMENVIVDAWNKKPIKPKSFEKSGAEIVKFLKKNKISGKAEQLGRGSFPLTKEWKKWGASNTTPKTDLTIGKARVSLKVAPSAQLMSGGKEESLATFMNALNDVKLKRGQKKVVDDIINTFDSFVKGVTKGKVGEQLKSKKDKAVLLGDKAHKEMMAKLNDFFQKNEDFRTAFASEAMSGFVKFGAKNIGSASHLLTVTKDGKQSKLKLTTDKKYSKEIADKMALSVRFKSTSRKLKGKKTGESNYWSVVGLVVNKLLECQSEYEGQVITEGILSSIASKVKEFFIKIIQKVKKFIGDSVENAMKFLGIEPQITLNNEISF